MRKISEKGLNGEGDTFTEKKRFKAEEKRKTGWEDGNEEVTRRFS